MWGCDVHAETIAVAVADAGRGEAQALGTIPNRPEAVARLMNKLGPAKTAAGVLRSRPVRLRVVLAARAVGDCTATVVAPTLVPVRTGDRVKTDRRDAAKLATVPSARRR